MESVIGWLAWYRSSPPVTNSAVIDGQKRGVVEDELNLESKTRKVITRASLFLQKDLDLPKSEVTAQVISEDVPSGVEGDTEGARRILSKEGVDSDGIESGGPPPLVVTSKEESSEPIPEGSKLEIATGDCGDKVMVSPANLHVNSLNTDSSPVVNCCVDVNSHGIPFLAKSEVLMALKDDALSLALQVLDDVPQPDFVVSENERRGSVCSVVGAPGNVKATLDGFGGARQVLGILPDPYPEGKPVPANKEVG
ncbi:hypothetical protein U1Q18_032649 [Sarracenia purpurea var. burkii]